MKSLVSRILTILLLAISIAAQQNEPTLIDEFGKMPYEELLARINGFSVEIGKSPNSKALVRISGGDKNYFGLPYVRGSLIKSGWKNNLKLPPEKLSIQFCDADEETIQTRFFIVRENDEVDDCNENLMTPKQTVLFENISYLDYGSQVNLESIENTYLPTDSFPVQYSEFALNVLKKFLQESPENKLYVIAYLQTNFEEDENGKVIVGRASVLDGKSFAQKMFRAARFELTKKGFSPSQIVTINGGYVNGNNRRLEFWFVPQGGAVPKPQPDYVPKKKRGQ